MFEGFLAESMVQRAVDKGLVQIELHQLRKWSKDPTGRVDDYPFGGGAGMVIKAQPLVDAIEELNVEEPFDEIIFLSPDGEMLTQALANTLSLKKRLLLIAGRYKGIDQRVRDGWVTREISIGDYVLTGGELPVAVLLDSIVRLIPGVLGDETSALTDSFQDGLLAPPVYTRPEDFRGLKVPEVLLGGHHAHIEEWRMEKALERTKALRPHLLEDNTLKGLE